MTEDEKLNLNLSERLLNLMLDEKVTFEKKKGKMDYLINLKADVNAIVYGKSLALWVKEFGDENLIKYVKERGGVENQISKKESEELGKQFWDDEGEVKSFKEIKELVLMGADLSVKNNRYKHIWKFLSFEEMNDILKNLPKGYVIDGDVDLSEKGLTELPDFSKIKVKGYFDCSENQLTDLKGAPSTVGGGFHCYKNQLTTLEGAPSEVGGTFNCSSNQLTTLEGVPIEVNGYFDCSNNQLTDLKGAPSKVGWNFNCEENRLTSLEGAPSEVGGSFYCDNNQLTTLQGAPSKVGGYFWCCKNQLTTLEGAPLKVGGNFWCFENQLTDLKGAPKEVGGDFDCRENQLVTLEGKPKKIGGWFVVEKKVLKKFEYKKENKSIWERMFGGNDGM